MSFENVTIAQAKALETPYTVRTTLPPGGAVLTYAHPNIGGSGVDLIYTLSFNHRGRIIVTPVRRFHAQQYFFGIEAIEHRGEFDDSFKNHAEAMKAVRAHIAWYLEKIVTVWDMPIVNTSSKRNNNPMFSMKSSDLHPGTRTRRVYELYTRTLRKIARAKHEYQEESETHKHYSFQQQALYAAVCKWQDDEQHFEVLLNPNDDGQLRERLEDIEQPITAAPGRYAHVARNSTWQNHKRYWSRAHRRAMYKHFTESYDLNYIPF